MVMDPDSPKFIETNFLTSLRDPIGLPNRTGNRCRYVTIFPGPFARFGVPKSFQEIILSTKAGRTLSQSPSVSKESVISSPHSLCLATLRLR